MLAQESRKNSVKAGTFTTKTCLSSAQSTEVSCCLWNFVCRPLEGHAAQVLVVQGDVEEHGGADRGWAWQHQQGLDYSPTIVPSTSAGEQICPHALRLFQNRKSGSHAGNASVWDTVPPNEVTLSLVILGSSCPRASRQESLPWRDLTLLSRRRTAATD